MVDLSKLKKMFELQKQLNDYTNGVNWIDGFTDKGLEIDWLRCIRMEMVEAIDQSLAWKHWKNIENTKQYEPLGEFGVNNLQIEFIDGWHFLISESIKQSWEVETINKISLFMDKEINLKGKNLLIQIDNIQKLCFKYEDDNTFDNFMDLIELYTRVSFTLLDLTKLYEKYVLKNVLNIFRQKNGYKENTYIKEWGVDKIEDNIFLTKYVSEGKKIDFDNLYSYLDNQYKTLNNKD